MKSIDGVRSRRLMRAWKDWHTALEQLATREPAEAARIASEARDQLAELVTAEPALDECA